MIAGLVHIVSESLFSIFVFDKIQVLVTQTLHEKFIISRAEHIWNIKLPLYTYNDEYVI